MLLYRLLFFIVLAFSAPFMLIKALWGKHGVVERLGFIPERTSNHELFWFHAASVGELKVLTTVLPEVKRLAPEIEFAISTTTATGRLQARRLFGDDIYIFLQPLELKSVINRSINRIKPSRLIVVETELWPLMLNIAHDSGIKLYLINARLSEKSMWVYQVFEPLISMTLKKFSAIMARTEIDALRYKSLGAESVSVIGNIKYDQVLNVDAQKPDISFPHNNLVFVAGSIRRGEDRILTDLIAKVNLENLAISCVVAPRHMKDVGDLEDQLQSQKIEYQLWSKIKNNPAVNGVPARQVLVVDTMGDLLNMYAIADITFIGGTLVPIGGHDPLEPASLGKPVLFGPNNENSKESAELLISSGGGIEVDSGDEILHILRRALANRKILNEIGQRGFKSIVQKAGISRKIAEILVNQA